MLLRFLREEYAESEERLLAAELAGDVVVLDDEIARTLLAIVGNEGENVELRRTAAIALGPGLEEADPLEVGAPDAPDPFGIEELEIGDAPLSEEVFLEIQETLHRLFRDDDVPRDVRRAALEASIHAPQEWHVKAVRDAVSSDDRHWRLTGIFCTRFIDGPGFDEHVLEALESEDPEIKLEAVQAAGFCDLEEAWPHVSPLVLGEDVEKPLRLAAIEVAAAIRPEEAMDLFHKLERQLELQDDADGDIRETLDEAMALCTPIEELDELDELGDEDEDEIPY